MSLAFRAGISERDFWGMTAHNIYAAFKASQENLSRLAYRTAHFSKLKHTVFNRGEEAFFATAFPKASKAKPQTLEDQLVMARQITVAMGGTVH
jgi:hypothetical protein